jgi:hypothetical protein
MQQKQPIPTLAIRILLTLFIASLVATMYIHYSYAAEMPRTPDPKTGRLYSITVNHGAGRFVSAGELRTANFILSYGWLFGTLCGVGAGVLKATAPKS